LSCVGGNFRRVNSNLFVNICINYIYYYIITTCMGEAAYIGHRITPDNIA